jgi:hypothetical protein
MSTNHHQNTRHPVAHAERRRARRTPRRLVLLTVAFLGIVAGLVVPTAAFASNPQGFSPYLSHNPRVFTLTGTNCTATVGFVFDNETAWQRIGGVTVSCGSRHNISATSVVQYSTTQYGSASTSAYYTPSGVARANASGANTTTFTNAYGFGGRILYSPGVCRGSASYSIFYTAANVWIDGTRYALTSWGYWNPYAGC